MRTVTVRIAPFQRTADTVVKPAFCGKSVGPGIHGPPSAMVRARLPGSRTVCRTRGLRLPAPKIRENGVQISRVQPGVRVADDLILAREQPNWSTPQEHPYDRAVRHIVAKLDGPDLFNPLHIAPCGQILKRFCRQCGPNPCTPSGPVYPLHSPASGRILPPPAAWREPG